MCPNILPIFFLSFSDPSVCGEIRYRQIHPGKVHATMIVTCILQTRTSIAKSKTNNFTIFGIPRAYIPKISTVIVQADKYCNYYWNLLRIYYDVYIVVLLIHSPVFSIHRLCARLLYTMYSPQLRKTRR